MLPGTESLESGQLILPRGNPFAPFICVYACVISVVVVLASSRPVGLWRAEFYIANQRIGGAAGGWSNLDFPY